MGTKAIASARVKNDAVDARTLAQLLRAGMLPEAYVAPRELRDVRELLRYRVGLTQMRTALKNRIHATLARRGIQSDHADLFGEAGREWLAELGLREPTRRRITSILSLIDDFDRELSVTTREIHALAKADDRVPVLCQIRGLGLYTAMLIIAEVGDVTRFPSARHLWPWRVMWPRRSFVSEARTLGVIPAQLGRASLGAVRGRPAGRPGRRAPARELRADRQAPRAPHRQGRDRPQDPHPQEIRCLAPRARTGAGLVLEPSQ
jgi:transposase